MNDHEAHKCEADVGVNSVADVQDGQRGERAGNRQ